jgi:hypothetical protein
MPDWHRILGYLFDGVDRFEQCNPLLSGRSIEGEEVTQLLEALGQLKSIIEEQLASIYGRLEHLTEVVREAVEELGVIRDIEDKKRKDIQWAVRNQQPIQLTSMPLDPAAPDWAKHVNELTPADLPDEPDRPSAARYQGNLWSDFEQ